MANQDMSGSFKLQDEPADEPDVIELMVQAFERDLEERQNFSASEMPDTPYTTEAMLAAVLVLAEHMDDSGRTFVSRYIKKLANERPRG